MSINDSTPLFNPDRMPPRDAFGHHFHPDLDKFTNDDEGPLRADDLRAAGFELSSLYLYNDHNPVATEISDACCRGNPDVTAWNPDRDGCYRAGIWDTEDGPVAVFVRPIEVGVSDDH